MGFRGCSHCPRWPGLYDARIHQKKIFGRHHGVVLDKPTCSLNQKRWQIETSEDGDMLLEAKIDNKWEVCSKSRGEDNELAASGSRASDSSSRVSSTPRVGP